MEQILVGVSFVIATLGIFTREEEHAGIEKMVIAVLIMLSAIYLKL